MRSIETRLQKLEDRAPVNVMMEVETHDGETKIVPAAEYATDTTTVFKKIVSGTRFSDLIHFVEGNKKRAHLILDSKEGLL